MVTQSKGLSWTGWIIAALIGVLMTFSAMMKLINPPEMAEQVGKLGYPEGCDVLYRCR